MLQIPAPIAMKPNMISLKSQFSAKRSTVKVRDANAARQQSLAGVAYTTRLVFTVYGRRMEILAGEELVSLSAFGEFDISRFTINAEDLSGFSSRSAGKVRLGPCEYEMFTEDGQLDVNQRQVLALSELLELLVLRRMEPGEALHLYRNCVVLYGRVDNISPRDVVMVARLADSLPPVKTAEPGFGLPKLFGDLQDVANHWLVSDDLERASRIERATSEELQQVVSELAPRIEGIQRWLNGSIQDSTPEAAANISLLEEFYFEANSTLQSRSTGGGRPWSQ